MDDPLVGMTIDGRYAVRRLLGRGGMGAVYQAEHLGLGKPVALKFMLPDEDPDAAARFRREARAASVVRHEHVIQVLDIGESDGRGYLVMEYVEGADLAHLLEAGPLAQSRALDLASQLLAGLEAIHAQGIVHRDIKPANVIVAAGDRAKLMDFGIAKTIRSGDDTVTRTGKVIGTPEYMAPEQLAGLPIDERADLYSAGLVMVAMLVGQLPASAFSRLLEPEAAKPLGALLPADLPPHVAAAIERALEPSPKARFGSAREMLDALAGKPTRDAAPTVAGRSSRDAVPTAAARPRDDAARVAAAPPREATAPPAPHDGARTQRTRRPRWPLAIVPVAGLAAVAAWVLVHRAPAHATAPRDASPADAVDHLGRARDAEHAGNLELAIAEYLAAAPAPEALYHLGDLSERLGRRDEAARYFERYLAAAPDASDRQVVTARLAALRPAPPVDAGVADAPVHHAEVLHAGPSWPPGSRKCSCIAPHLPPLCSTKQATPSCECITTNSKPLCRFEWHVERDGKIYDLGHSGQDVCTDPARAECNGAGKKPDDCYAYVTGTRDGAPCQGYSDEDAQDQIVTGKVWCTLCESIWFGGKADGPCAGYSSTTGELVRGTLECD